MAKSSIKLIDKEEIIPEKPVIPECNIQELILERNAFSKAAKERDGQLPPPEGGGLLVIARATVD
jgi:hypothetical protein